MGIGTYQLSVGSGLAGASLASVSGPSVLVLDQTLVAGSYAYVVSGTSRCSFALTVTTAAP